MTSGAANLSARLAASYRWAAALACATLLIACNGSGTLTGGGGSGNGTAPTISTQPRSQTVNAGATAMFSVVAAGGGTLAYQWEKNGAAVAGATSASYTTPPTVAGDSGASFTVVVSCAVVPCVSDTDEGATATLAADAPATVTLTFVFFLPADAVTVVVPVETPVTKPVPLTVASDGSPDDQDTVVDIDCPCEFRTLAVSCADCFG